MKLKIAVILGIFLILLSQGIFADILSFQQGANGYTGCEDTTIEMGSTSDTSTRNYLYVSANASSESRRVFVKFGNIFGSGTGQIPLGSAINSATLTLTSRGIENKTTALLDLYAVKRNWIQTEVSWDEYSAGNIWQTQGALGDDDIVKPAGSSATAVGSGTYDFDVAGIIRDISNGTIQNYGFLIDPAEFGFLHWQSSCEDAQDSRPLLTVDFSASCTPGETLSCSTGLQGICSVGTKTCQGDESWGSCAQDELPVQEVCDDSLDNDCDGETDCSDPNCAEDVACPSCTPKTEICDNGLDEDCDLLIDCADTADCSGAPNCEMGNNIVLPFDYPNISNELVYPYGGVSHRAQLGVATIDGIPNTEFRYNMVPNRPTNISIIDSGRNAVGGKIQKIPGNTYYVSISGSDSAGGSASSPWGTVRRAFDRSRNTYLRAGDTLLIHSGTYNESTIEPRESGTANAPITVKSFGDGEVIITSSNDYTFWIHEGGPGYYVFEGLTIKNTGTNPSGESRKLMLMNTHNTVLRNMKFENNDALKRWLLQINGNDNVIEYCDFSGNIYSQGIEIGTTNTEFRYNKVHDASGAGDGIMRFYGEGFNIVVRNNVFWNNSDSRLMFLYRAYNTWVADNLVYDSVGGGETHWNIVHVERANNDIIQGNTFVCRDPNAAAISIRGYGTDISDNVLINCANEGAIKFLGEVHPLYRHGLGLGYVPFCCDELSHDNEWGDCADSATCEPTEYNNNYSNNYFFGNTHYSPPHDPDFQHPGRWSIIAKDEVHFDEYFPDNLRGAIDPFSNLSGGDFTLKFPSFWSSSSPHNNSTDGRSAIEGGDNIRDVGAFEYGVTPWVSWNGSDWVFNSLSDYKLQLATTNITPTFSWTFNDYDNAVGGGDPSGNHTAHVQASFRAQIDTTPDFDSDDLIDSGIYNSSTSEWTVPVALARGKYYFRVQAGDQLEPDILGNWNDLYFRFEVVGSAGICVNANTCSATCGSPTINACETDNLVYQYDAVAAILNEVSGLSANTDYDIKIENLTRGTEQTITQGISAVGEVSFTA